MKRRPPRTREEFYSEVERQWLRTARPESKLAGVINTIIFVVVVAALFVAAYLNRARIGEFWRQKTGRPPPAWLVPAKPEREAPDSSGQGS